MISAYYHVDLEKLEETMLAAGIEEAEGLYEEITTLHLVNRTQGKDSINYLGEELPPCRIAAYNYLKDYYGFKDGQPFYWDWSDSYLFI